MCTKGICASHEFAYVHIELLCQPGDHQHFAKEECADADRAATDGRAAGRGVPAQCHPGSHPSPGCRRWDLGCWVHKQILFTSTTFRYVLSR